MVQSMNHTLHGQVVKVRPLTSRGCGPVGVRRGLGRGGAGPWGWPRRRRGAGSAPAGGGSHRGRRQGDLRASRRPSSSLPRQPVWEEAAAEAVGGRQEGLISVTFLLCVE